ncbi:MAG: hypothetical protein EA416_00405, partial [Trueperaceae bacterium]
MRAPLWAGEVVARGARLPGTIGGVASGPIRYGAEIVTRRLNRDLIEGLHPERFDVHSTADGPEGTLPLTEALLRDSPSGDLFGLSQNVG